MKKLLLGAMLLSHMSHSMNYLKFFHIVKHQQYMVLERFGKFHRILSPGLNFTIPVVDVPRAIDWSYEEADSSKQTITKIRIRTDRIDTREKMVQLPEEQIITKDNVRMAINALIYYRISNAQEAVYGVENLPKALLGVSQTALRNEIGSLTLDDTLTSRDRINQNLRTILAHETAKWGADITRVELKEVNPPQEILKAMERQMSAERNRRADIINAEGIKAADILKAEGERQATITRADGAAQARVLDARSKKTAMELEGEGTKNSLSMIAESMPHSDPGAYLIAQRYIEMFPQATKNPGTILMSHDMSTLGIAKVMQRLLSDSKQDKK